MATEAAAGGGHILHSPGESVPELGGEAQALIYLEPSRTLWRLPKNILLTSGRSKVTSCKAALGSWLK